MIHFFHQNKTLKDAAQSQVINISQEKLLIKKISNTVIVI